MALSVAWHLPLSASGFVKDHKLAAMLRVGLQTGHLRLYAM